MMVTTASDKYVLRAQNAKIWKKYKDIQSVFWTFEEIDTTKDRADWEKLNDDERFFIKNILAFFAGSDGIVLENIAVNFMRDVDIPEARAFYSYQMYNESIHSETYSGLLDLYIQDPDEKDRLFSAIETIPCVTKKAEWAIHWIENHTKGVFADLLKKHEGELTVDAIGDLQRTAAKVSLAQRLVAFAIVEGVFFSGSFCAIYWLKQRGLMPGLTFSNELISKDEGLHTDFAVTLFNDYYGVGAERPHQDVIHRMFKEAVDIEKEFICESLPCDLIGMNSRLMGEYIEYVADRLILQLGYEPIWETKCPFDFMELISLRPKSNFFEVRVGEYKKAGVGDEVSPLAEDEFGGGDDF